MTDPLDCNITQTGFIFSLGAIEAEKARIILVWSLAGHFLSVHSVQSIISSDGHLG